MQLNDAEKIVRDSIACIDGTAELLALPFHQWAVSGSVWFQNRDQFSEELRYIVNLVIHAACHDQNSEYELEIYQAKRFVVTYDNGSGWFEWSSQPQPTEELAKKASGFAPEYWDHGYLWTELRMEQVG
jgi:hypothetical protein